jgi:predicted nucleic acid-binding protein
MIFVDTSAFFALADRADLNHRRATTLLKKLAKQDEPLFTHNYVFVETAALLQRRLSFQSAVKFLGDMGDFPMVWIDQMLHERAARAFSKGKPKTVSFVDYTSFILMREREVDKAFAFDDDFRKAGFALCS